MECPFKDFLGSEIKEGNTLMHPSGEKFTVKYVHGCGPWRAVYEDGESLWLANQVNEKGQAVLYKDKPE
jgi:hypothetical protein